MLAMTHNLISLKAEQLQHDEETKVYVHKFTEYIHILAVFPHAMYNLFRAVVVLVIILPATYFIKTLAKRANFVC